MTFAIRHYSPTSLRATSDVTDTV